MHLDATSGLMLAFLQAALQQGPEPGDSGAYYRGLLWLQELCVQRLGRDPAELWLEQGQAVLGLPLAVPGAGGGGMEGWRDGGSVEGWAVA
jgi:hypothetical protein